MKRYRIVLTLLLTILLPKISHSQVLTDSLLTLTSYWSKGDIMQYHVKQTQEKSNTKKGNTSMEYDMTIEVIDETDTSYTLVVHYDNYLFSGKQKLMEEILSKLTFADDFQLTYQVSEFGDFLQVLNWEEVSKVVIKSIDEFVAIDDNLTDEEKQHLKFTIHQQVSTQEQIEAFFTQDLKQLHYLFGISLSLHQADVYEKYYVNPYMEEFFVGEEQFNVVSIDTNNMTAQVLIKAKLPEENTKKLMEDYMNKIARDMGSDEQVPEDMVPLMSISERSTYQLDINTGIVLRYQYSKTINVKEESTTLNVQYQLVN